MKSGIINIIKYVLYFVYAFIGLSLNAQIEIGVPYGHRRSITDLHLSDDGKELMTVGLDNMVIFWDVSTGRTKRTVKLDGNLICAGYLEDKKYFIISTYSAKVADQNDSILYQYRSEEPILFSYRSKSGPVSFVIDTMIHSLNTSTFEILSESTGFTSPSHANIYNFSFSDDQLIYVSDGIISGRNCVTGEVFELRTEKEFEYTTYESVAIDDDNINFVLNDSLFIYSRENLSFLSSHDLTKADLDNVSVHISSSKKLFLLRARKAIHLVSRKNDLPVWTKSYDTNNSISSFYDKANDDIIVTHDNELHILSVQKGDEHLTITFEEIVTHVQTMKDLLIVVLNGIKVMVLSRQNGATVAEFQGHVEPVISSAYDQTNKVLATTNQNGSTRLWSLKTGTLVRELKGHKRSVRVAEFSDDGSFLLTSSFDQTNRVWDLSTGRELSSRTAIGYEMSPSRFIGNGEHVISLGNDTVYCWSSQNGKIIWAYSNGKSRFNSYNFPAIDPANNMVVALDRDGAFHALNAQTGELKGILKGNRTPFVKSYNFNISGDLLAAGNDDGDLFVWNMKNGMLDYKLSDSLYNIEYCTLIDTKRLLYIRKKNNLSEVVLIDRSDGSRLNKFGHKGGLFYFEFNRDSTYFLTTGEDQVVRIWKTIDLTLMNTIDNFRNTTYHASFISDSSIIVSSTDGSYSIWDNLGANLRSRKFCIDGDSEKTIEILPEGYYYSQKNAFQFMHFLVDGNVFPFDQFDLKYNRPDLVYERLGYGSKEERSQLETAYRKRLKKLKIDPNQFVNSFHLPVVKIRTEVPVSTNKSKIDITFDASDSLYLLNRIMIHVNHIPIDGVDGVFVLNDSLQQVKFNRCIELQRGLNLIEISAINEVGIESLKQSFRVNCLKPTTTKNLYFVGIGAKEYEESIMDLKFSDKDIRDVLCILKKSDVYDKIFIDTFFNEDVNAQLIEQVRKRLKTSTTDDQVIIMYSGHGVLDENLNYYLATYNIDFNNPDKKGISYDSLELLFDKIPARKRLLLLDACHSGEVDKEEMELSSNSNAFVKAEAKGDLFKQVRSKGNSFDLMNKLFVDLRRGTGTIVISSSAGKYYSYEDNMHQNGLYTYALKEGLMGAADINNDEQITINEIKTYLFNRVDELSDGIQKPTIRQDNLEVDFRIY